MNKDSLLNNVLVPVAREGWPFITIFGVVTAVLFLIYEPLGWLGLVLTAWCVYFFRNPDRVTPEKEGLIISPADGMVQMIAEVLPPEELDMGKEPVVRVSVFMNVFDCHVNRLPCDGRIGKLNYIPGRFVNAAFDKASEENERQLIRIIEIVVVQIAGLIARRILSFVKPKDNLSAGERFGLIRFGSRVDIYLPAGTVSQAIIGQKCISGETVLADMNSDEPSRSGEVR